MDEQSILKRELLKLNRPQKLKVCYIVCVFINHNNVYNYIYCIFSF